MTAPPAGSAGPVAAARRSAETAVGLAGLQRLTRLAERLLGAAAAQVSLLTDVQTVAAGAGLAEGSVGARSPLPESLCTVTAAGAPGAMVIPDAVTDARVATLPPVASGGPHPDDDVALLAVRLPPQP